VDVNGEAFAARRRADFVRADADLAPSVARALELYRLGEADWDQELIEDASVIWLEHYAAEAPNADPTRAMERFQEALRRSLAQTDQPETPDHRVQTTRVTRWVGTYTINDATYQGASARGVRNKRWATMHDRSVREVHDQADGQVRPIAAPFNVGGYEMRYPGEPVGPPELWINCRCVVQPAARRGDLNVSTTTFAIDEAVETLDDEDIPTDELEDDEEEITEIPVHGVLAPEGVATGDGRMFAEGGLTTRDLPLPIAYQPVSGDGHGGAATVGRIDEVFRQGSEMRFRGALVLSKEYSGEVIEGILDGTVRGISVDVDDIEIDMALSEDGAVGEQTGRLPVTVFAHARIAGVTIVPIPAFQEAFMGLGHEFADELSPEALAACAACAEEGPDDELDENEDIEVGYDVYRDVPAAERKRLADKNQAMPDGSYPIANVQDLKNAIQSIGRAKNPDAVKAHIKRRARALGHPELIPDGWALIEEWLDAADQELIAAGFAPGTHDGPGWITHPIPTGRIRRYWVHGKGAAKIRWGQGGDFNRCRRQLAKYIKNPSWLAGACANMHKEALGIWPATHAGKRRRGHSLAASGEPAPMFTLVAGANYIFDKNLFQRQELEDPRVGVVVEGDHIYGYVAQWGVCHIGISGVCTEAPPSQTDYWYYATGTLDTDNGPVRVGQITMDTGHAPLRATAKVAAAHYDNTGAAVADVAVGEDDFGIWFSGALRKTVTDDQRHALRAAGRLSGDWRELGGHLELVAALAVNVPGLPIPHTLVASADGVQTALVAAGIVLPEEPLAVTASGLDADTVAGIVRTAVDEYRYAEQRAQRVAPLRQSLREKRIIALRSKIKE
jgi:hypothetical protein